MPFPGEKTTYSSHPLFSSIITLYILILLYFPTLFLSIILSPVLISTSILLLSLLRLGAIQKTIQEHPENNETHDFFTDDLKWVSSKYDQRSETLSDSGYSGAYVEWDVRAPLEVIYEEYEGQEEEDSDEDEKDDVLGEKRDAQMAVFERYASLSKFYPESDDSDASSEDDEENENFPAIRDWDSPENLCSRWEGEGEDRYGLIEIALDEEMGFSDGEEDNLIEINLYPASFQAR